MGQPLTYLQLLQLFSQIMGQYYSTEIQDGGVENFVESKGGVSYDIMLSNPTKFLPLKLSRSKLRTTRFLCAEKRRLEFLGARVSKARTHNISHVADVLTRKEFLKLGKIDLAIFKERRPRRVVNIKPVVPRRYNRGNDFYRGSKTDVKRARQNNRRQTRNYTNYDYRY